MAVGLSGGVVYIVGLSRDIELEGITQNSIPINATPAEEQKQVCLDLIYDRRRDGYDPLTELLALFEGVESTAVEKEDRSGWPVQAAGSTHA